MSVFPVRIRWRSVWAAARRRAAAVRSLQTSRRATVTTRRSLATTPPQHGLDDVGAANLDWPRLGFDFQKTNGFVKHTWVNGKWDEGEWEPEPFPRLGLKATMMAFGAEEWLLERYGTGVPAKAVGWFCDQLDLH